MGEFLANSNSKPGMAELKQIMYNSLALSTRSIYQTALKKFQEFSRAHHSLPSWSLSISTLFHLLLQNIWCHYQKYVHLHMMPYCLQMLLSYLTCLFSVGGVVKEEEGEGHRFKTSSPHTYL